MPKRYGLLDDFGEVVRWFSYPPVYGEYITARIPAPTPETYGEARW